MRSVLLLLLGLAVLGCSGPRDAESANGRDDPGISLDPHAFDALEFPDMAGKPFVVLTGHSTERVGLLLEDTPDHFMASR